MTEPRSRRVFFGTWPDKAATCRLSALAQELAAAGGGRPTRSTALHLTLAFVGAVAPGRVAELEETAAGVRGEAFELSLDRLGFWPQRGILWAGCRRPPAPLIRLRERLVAGVRDAGFAIDHGSAAGHVPHLTLARRVRCASLPRLETPIRWRVGEFALVESHLNSSAASYATLASFALDRADAE